MASPTLVIGVGGTGIRVLIRIKERLLEAYDRVPKEIILFELDTDDYRDNRITFNEIGLLCTGDLIGDHEVTDDIAEFYHVHTKEADETVDKVFDLQKARTPEWQWVNANRVNASIQAQEDRVIKMGARTVRPIGKSALYFDFNAVYSHLEKRLMQVLTLHQSYVQTLNNLPGEVPVVQDDRKATVFVVASAAGGSGAGMVIDILRMLEHMRTKGHMQAQQISIMALLVGGRSFASDAAENPRVNSNTFALLRELDRLGAVAGKNLSRLVPPVMVAPKPVGRFSSNYGPADQILLFDSPDRLGRERDVDQRGVDNPYLERVVAPTVADLIVAFADERIAPVLRTVRADINQNFMKEDPFGDEGGYFPYTSAGTHTLIFPERDVRKSAGLRWLLEMWQQHLVQPSQTTSNLPPASRDLWGEELPHTESGLTSSVFADQGFSRTGNVCTGAANSPFIYRVVTSSIASEIRLPRVGTLRAGSTIERVIKQIGIPNAMRGERVDLDRLGQQVSGRIDRSIELLDRQRDANGVKEWREQYLGTGVLGNEMDGEWLTWLRGESTIRGHSDDFEDTLRKVVLAILNDKDGEGRQISYRLQYADAVLKQLENRVRQWTEGNPSEENSISLINDYFEKISDERERENLRQLETAAIQGDKFGAYIRANKKYARKKKELLGKQLLTVLCEDLLREIRTKREELQAWQKYLQRVDYLLGEAQTTHENNRKEKARIPVRTYVVNCPTGKDYKDSEFEKNLYAKHREKATNNFLSSLEWSWEAALELESPFGRKGNPQLSEKELVNRAIIWACTRDGNLDRPDTATPFRDLASPDEVKIPVRIRDHFGNEQALVNVMTNERLLASLCPMERWPSGRLMYVMALRRTAPASENVEDFYETCWQRIIAATRPPRYHDRSTHLRDPENPRHSIAIEFTLGFQLHHRRDHADYLDTYIKHTHDRLYALHCMPEEDIASTYFELYFRPSDELYKDLGLQPFTLDPIIVDVLGNIKRLELFVQCLMLGEIGLLDRDLRATDGADFYLWPKDKPRRIRLSKMNTADENRAIAGDLVKPRNVPQLTSKSLIMNQLRLAYAVRTFALLEHDVDDRRKPIPYEEVIAQVENTIGSMPLDKRISGYDDWVEKFLGYYKEHNGKYNILAHLGLVLARVAFELRDVEKAKE